MPARRGGEIRRHSIISKQRHPLMKYKSTSHPCELNNQGASSYCSSAMTRRDFLGTVTLASAALSNGAGFGALPSDGKRAPPGKILLQSFDHVGVKLRPSRWQKQYADARACPTTTCRLAERSDRSILLRKVNDIMFIFILNCAVSCSRRKNRFALIWSAAGSHEF